MEISPRLMALYPQLFLCFTFYTIMFFFFVGYKITLLVNIMKSLFWTIADVGRCCGMEPPKLYKGRGK